jgi:hypothetical protein
LFAGLIAFSYSRKTETPLMGKPAPVNINVEKDEDYCPPVTMGTPVPITRDKDTPIAGGITNIEEVREQAKKKRNR